MVQLREARGRATSVVRREHYVCVTYHNTQVVEADAFSITLRSGGWQTYTTKARMNQASNQFGLGYSVYQHKREWFVSYQGQKLPFVDGMRLAR